MSAIVVLPEVTRKRMLILQNLLQSWQSEKITSVQISEITGWKDSLIRHDLWLLGYNKGISNGYLKDDLQIICISRAGKVIIPHGNDMIMPDDLVVVITKHKGLNDLDDILNRR